MLIVLAKDWDCFQKTLSSVVESFLLDSGYGLTVCAW